ncbi:MAG TPA: hypothetical protein VLY04_23045 [Bryobacteraceae bacterium]|nr:hypothetical protein [Bryobacteraceae bacterium]
MQNTEISEVRDAQTGMVFENYHWTTTVVLEENHGRVFEQP